MSALKRRIIRSVVILSALGTGAVSSPTYYPGTPNVSEARTVLITAGGLVGSGLVCIL